MSSPILDQPNDYLVAALVSRIAGILSLAVWLFAQLPQILENYLNESVSGVSLAFLACWIGGDVTNFVGCILTGALPFQTCLATYYCFIDMIFTLQFWYYSRVYPRQKIHHNMLQSPDMMRPVTCAGSIRSRSQSQGRTQGRSRSRSMSRQNRFDSSPNGCGKSLRSRSALSTRSSNSALNVQDGIFRRLLAGSVLSSSFKGAKAYPLGFEQVSKSDNDSAFIDKAMTFFQMLIVPIKLIAKASSTTHDGAIIGTICGWCSTCLYVSSRSPQIWKNYCSKSTQGISPYLFLFAMLGNSLYTISILADLYLLSKYEQYLGDTDFHTVFQSQLPFLVGSSGTVIFDFVLLIQFYIYGQQSSLGHLKLPKNTYMENRTRFRKRSHSSFKQHIANTHFTKPDWYTNTNEADRMGIFDAYNDEDSGSTQISSPKSSFLFNRNPNTNPNQGETASLLHSSIASPPLHYVMSSSQIDGTYPRRSRKSITGAFSAVAKSLSQNSFIRASSFTSSPGSSASPMRDTSLIPSLVGTYSSLSKRMLDENKVPFLPIDFLQNDFLHRGDSDLESNH